jgi:hypothetical protein
MMGISTVVDKTYKEGGKSIACFLRGTQFFNETSLETMLYTGFVGKLDDLILRYEGSPLNLEYLTMTDLCLQSMTIVIGTIFGMEFQEFKLSEIPVGFMKWCKFAVVQFDGTAKNVKGMEVFFKDTIPRLQEYAIKKGFYLHQAYTDKNVLPELVLSHKFNIGKKYIGF